MVNQGKPRWLSLGLIGLAFGAALILEIPFAIFAADSPAIEFVGFVLLLWCGGDLD